MNNYTKLINTTPETEEWLVNSVADLPQLLADAKLWPGVLAKVLYPNTQYYQLSPTYEWIAVGLDQIGTASTLQEVPPLPRDTEYVRYRNVAGAALWKPVEVDRLVAKIQPWEASKNYDQFEVVQKDGILWIANKDLPTNTPFSLNDWNAADAAVQTWTTTAGTAYQKGKVIRKDAQPDAGLYLVKNNFIVSTWAAAKQYLTTLSLDDINAQITNQPDNVLVATLDNKFYVQGEDAGVIDVYFNPNHAATSGILNGTRTYPYNVLAQLSGKCDNKRLHVLKDDGAFTINSNFGIDFEVIGDTIARLQVQAIQSLSSTVSGSYGFTHLSFVSPFIFNNTAFKTLTFNDCRFASSARFNDFDAENVIFKNCIFMGDVTILRANPTATVKFTFENCEFNNLTSIDSTTPIEIQYEDCVFNNTISIVSTNNLGIKAAFHGCDFTEHTIETSRTATFFDHCNKVKYVQAEGRTAAKDTNFVDAITCYLGILDLQSGGVFTGDELGSILCMSPNITLSLGSFLFDVDKSLFPNGLNITTNSLAAEQVVDRQLFQRIAPASERQDDINKAIDDKFGALTYTGHPLGFVLTAFQQSYFWGLTQLIADPQSPATGYVDGDLIYPQIPSANGKVVQCMARVNVQGGVITSLTITRPGTYLSDFSSNTYRSTLTSGNGTGLMVRCVAQEQPGSKLSNLTPSYGDTAIVLRDERNGNLPWKYEYVLNQVTNSGEWVDVDGAHNDQYYGDNVYTIVDNGTFTLTNPIKNKIDGALQATPLPSIVYGTDQNSNQITLPVAALKNTVDGIVGDGTGNIIIDETITYAGYYALANKPPFRKYYISDKGYVLYTDNTGNNIMLNGIWLDATSDAPRDAYQEMSVEGFGIETIGQSLFSAIANVQMLTQNITAYPNTASSKYNVGKQYNVVKITQPAGLGMFYIDLGVVNLAESSRTTIKKYIKVNNLQAGAIIMCYTGNSAPLQLVMPLVGTYIFEVWDGDYALVASEPIVQIETEGAVQRGIEIGDVHNLKDWMSIISNQFETDQWRLAELNLGVAGSVPEVRLEQHAVLARIPFGTSYAKPIPFWKDPVDTNRNLVDMTIVVVDNQSATTQDVKFQKSEQGSLSDIYTDPQRLAAGASGYYLVIDREKVVKLNASNNTYNHNINLEMNDGTYFSTFAFNDIASSAHTYSSLVQSLYVKGYSTVSDGMPASGMFMKNGTVYFIRKAWATSVGSIASQGYALDGTAEIYIIPANYPSITLNDGVRIN